MIKKLIIITVIAAAFYGVWTYLQTIQQDAASKGNKLKPSEEALKDAP